MSGVLTGWTSHVRQGSGCYSVAQGKYLHIVARVSPGNVSLVQAVECSGNAFSYADPSGDSLYEVVSKNGVEYLGPLAGLQDKRHEPHASPSIVLIEVPQMTFRRVFADDVALKFYVPKNNGAYALTPNEAKERGLLEVYAELRSEEFRKLK